MPGQTLRLQIFGLMHDQRSDTSCLAHEMWRELKLIVGLSSCGWFVRIAQPRSSTSLSSPVNAMQVFVYIAKLASTSYFDIILARSGCIGAAASMASDKDR
jgi:hypothetical protein